MEDIQQPKVPPSSYSKQVTPADSDKREPPALASAVSTSGGSDAFRDLQRQLADEDLKNPGVQKLLLHMLQQANDERDRLIPYVNQFHETDKTVAVLREKVKAYTAIDIFLGVGVGLGCTMIGLVPWLWSLGPEVGIIAGILGFVLVIVAIIVRVVKK